MGITDEIFGHVRDWHRVPTKTGLTHTEYFELRDWLDNCTRGQYFIVSIADIRFKLHEDAVMFTLRWG